MSTQLHETMRTLRHRLRVDFGPGAQLPNEQTLAASFGVSRATVREAVSRLVVEGSLEKRWGVGTFVLETEPVGSFGLLSFRPGIVASLSATGGVVTLPFSCMTTGKADVSAFPDFPGAETLNLQRVYAVDGTPAMFVRDIMVMEFGGQRIDTGTGDWMKLLVPDLLAQIGLVFTQLKMHLDARACTDEEGDHLSLAPGSPVLSAAGHALDESGRILLHVHSVIRTDVTRPSVSSSPTELALP